jgi:hypothetical protein
MTEELCMKTQSFVVPAGTKLAKYKKKVEDV